jgi:hypothetical protein
MSSKIHVRWGRGCSTFAASIHYPATRLTGYYALRGNCYTPPPHHRTGFDFDSGRARPPARQEGQGCVA